MWRVMLAGALAAPVMAAAQPKAAKAVLANGPGMSVAQADPAAPPAAPVTPEAPVSPGLQDMGPLPEAGDRPEGPLAPINPLLNNVTEFVTAGRPKAFPLHMMVLLDTSVGAGNFMLNQNARQPYVANTVRLSPSLSLWKSLRVSARIDITKEWIASSTQTTTVPNQIVLGDLWMGVAMPNIYTEPFTGIGFGAGVWAFAPVSIQSRAETLITAVRPWALVTWNKWDFSFSYNLSARKNFHEYQHPTIDARQSFNQDCPNEGRCFLTPSIATGPAVNVEDGKIRVAGNRTLDLRRRNVSHTFIHILSGGYTFFDSLTPSATFMLASSFRYPQEAADQFTSPNARGNSWGHTDVMVGVLDVTYSPFDHVAFSTGVFNFQPVFADHRGSGLPGWNQSGLSGGVQDSKLVPNFPFFDFFTPGNNYTSFYFDITVSI